MYKLTEGTSIKRLADGAIIPADEKNKDYIKYLKWVDEGGVPDPIYNSEELAAKEKEDAMTLIDTTFQESFNQPIDCIDGGGVHYFMRNDEESCTRLLHSIQFADLVKADVVNLIDFSGTAHMNVPVADATEILKQMVSDYTVQDKKKLEDKEAIKS